MSKKTLKYLLALSFLLLASCGTYAPAPQKTQLEIRQMQTHVFDVKDYNLVMKAMLNVLQDEGFVVSNVQLNLGFLSAKKEIDIESPGVRFWGGGFASPDRWPKLSILNATSNVTEFGSKTKVRVNFQLKKLDNYGATLGVYQVQEPEFYQTFFSKVSKSIFIQEEKL